MQFINDRVENLEAFLNDVKEGKEADKIKDPLDVENVTFIGSVEESADHDMKNLLKNKTGALKTIIEASGHTSLKTNIFEVNFIKFHF